jgi:polysaccharide biosynthesis transport protein
VTTPPTRFELASPDPFGAPDGRPTRDAGSGGNYWGLLVRNKLLIAACAAVVTLAVALYTYWQTPVFSAVASLQLQDRQPNLPDIYRTASAGSAGSEIATELQVLGSRALKEDAAGTLSLQLRVLEPSRVARAELVSDIGVSADAPVNEYRLVRRADGRFAVFIADSLREVAVSGPDQRVSLPGISFVLLPAARQYEQVVIGVSSLSSAVDALAALSVDQPDHNANILTLSYSDVDSLIARQVPNTILGRYMARRKHAEKSEAGSTAGFLRDQLQRVTAQLAGAEEEFRRYREQEQVLDPTVQTSGEVSRLISKESERSSLEAERSALQKSLTEIDSAGARPGGPSPYRRLIGLPFLLRNEAASALLNALVAAENDKAAHVSATAADPDVQVLNAKISDLEEQLHSITTTYLQGLGNQVEALDATLAGFGRELNSIPGKQLTYGRLERNVKGLESVYELLQTRLNEAEIAEAVEDASVQVVDSAVTPLGPSSPQPLINLAAGLAVGLMFGVAVACVREYRDRSVHSRHDVQVATGIPVLGLIPRLPRARGRIPLIMGWHRLKNGGAGSPAGRPGQSPTQENYAFVGTPRLHGAPAVAGNGAHSGALSSVELTTSQWTNVVSEAYSLLLTNVTFARSTPPKTVVITSPLAEDGKTTCAVNLAITLALRGGRALLIDADLRRGVVHRALGVERSPGLSEVLSERLPFTEAVRKIGIDRQGASLHFLTTGSIPANPAVLLQSPAYPELLEQLKDQYDMVIIDSPPANIISDASILGLNADVALVVARSGMTESASLAYAVEQLTRLGVPVLGVVLNDIDFDKDAAYDASYRSHGAREYLSASTES